LENSKRVAALKLDGDFIDYSRLRWHRATMICMQEIQSSDACHVRMRRSGVFPRSPAPVVDLIGQEESVQRGWRRVPAN
jgi:hypothetical protein